MNSEEPIDTNLPTEVVALQKRFGGPSQSAFGSAVFFNPNSRALPNLEAEALAVYKTFVGESWERFGEANWLGQWACIYTRASTSLASIEAELRALADRETRQSADLLLENHEAGEAARVAIRNAFDSPMVAELGVFKIGDGEAMAGLLIAAKLRDCGVVVLALLMD